MSSGRMHYRNDIHMVTNRCEEGRFFLKPTRRIRELTSYWFARSMDMYGAGLEVYAFCFMCNHFHMLCRDTGGQLARFMEYFQGNLAWAINQELGRGKAHLWQGHYDDQIIEGPRMFWRKYLYVLTNPVKAGLVNHVGQWRGFCSYRASLGSQSIVVSGVNRTRHHNASRGKKKRKAREFVERFEFHLTTPPGLEEMSPSRRATEIFGMVRKAEAHYAGRRDNKTALGMEGVMSISSFYRPPPPARIPRRRFACDSSRREKERLDEYRQFIGAYKLAYAQFRSASLRGFGFHVEWPRGSFPPSCDQVVMALDGAA